MGAAKKVGIAVGIIIVAFFALVIAVAATTQPSETRVENTIRYAGTHPDEIVGISAFSISKQGSMYQASFQLTNEEISPATSDAKVNLVVKLANTLTSNDGNIIYSDSFNVRADEFEDYVRTFTGADTGKMYLWVIDNSEFSELSQYDYAFGKAILTVTLPNGKTFTADSSVLS